MRSYKTRQFSTNISCIANGISSNYSANTKRTGSKDTGITYQIGYITTLFQLQELYYVQFDGNMIMTNGYVFIWKKTDSLRLLQETILTRILTRYYFYTNLHSKAACGNCDIGGSVTFELHVWVQFLRFKGGGGGKKKEIKNTMCSVHSAKRDRRGYKKGRWVTWLTREWRVPGEWLMLNIYIGYCDATTGRFTPPP